MIGLSIITPTYNRARLIRRCFESLLRQSCKDFEWIIVDDGSTDNTQDVISEFCTDAFHITKIAQENGGKHTALNAAHPYVHGKYVLILDSDDYLTDTAVEEVLKAWERYEKEDYIGILTFLRGKAYGNPICTVEDYGTPVDILRYRRQSHYGSDCCEVVRTKLFLQYPFPVYEGERFVSECALWNRIGLRYKCVYINSIVYICEYLDGGLTKSGRCMRIKNPRGGMYTSNLRTNKKNFVGQRIKYGILYTCYGFFANYGVGKQIKEADCHVLTGMCCPIGFLLYLRWKKRYL